MEFLTHLESRSINQFSFSLREFWRNCHFSETGSWSESVGWGPGKTHQGVASLLSTRANAASGVLVRSHCLTAKICLSQALLYLLSSKRASETIMPNKLGPRSKHRSTQHVWWARCMREQLDPMFRCMEHLLSDSALSSVLKEKLFGKLEQEEKKWILLNKTGKIPCHLHLSLFLFNTSGLCDKMWERISLMDWSKELCWADCQ